MEDLHSNLKDTKSFNPWDDARILSHIRTHDFARLKNFNAVNVMPTRFRNRDPVDNANDNYYASDRTSFNYMKANNTFNTMHLQNPYRPPQRLEGYMSHDYSKVRSRMLLMWESTLRSEVNVNSQIYHKSSSNLLEVNL